MSLTGGIVIRYDELYSDARLNYNRAFDDFPCYINFCFTEEDVANAIIYARKNNINFRVRSGRHDYEANSNVDNGLIIDISNISYVKLDCERNIAKVGGGILAGKMYEELAIKGYTIPAGTCSDVGFAGLSTCGGVGFAARYLGLSCDNLIEVDLINYNGEKITANSHCNSELFWALRGGLGANFGVIISLTYNVTPVCTASTYVIEWDFKYFNQVVDGWQKITPYLDNRLTTDLTASKNCCELKLSSAGQFFGSKEELFILIRDLRKIAPTLSVEIEELPYLEVLKKWNNNCFPPNKYKGTGSYIYSTVDPLAIELIKENLITSPDYSNNIYEFIGLGGEVSNVSNKETAYPHREALYLVEIKSIYPDCCCGCDAIKWANESKELFDTVGCGTYRGFTDFNLCDWQFQYYGENYNRLRKVKELYDPENVFSFPQSIER